MTNIPVQLRNIADDLEHGCPPEVMLLAADGLYAYADELYAYAYPDKLDSRGGNSLTRSTTVNPLVSDSLGSIIRWALTLVVPMMVTWGIWTPEQSTAVITGATTALLALAWSLYQKYIKDAEVEAALAAPAGTSRAMLSRSL